MSIEPRYLGKGKYLLSDGSIIYDSTKIQRERYDDAFGKFIWARIPKKTMKKYEFRKWNLYQEWYVVEATDEEEARKKLEEMGEDDIETSKFVGQEGETELYRTTDLGDEEEELPKSVPLVQENALDGIAKAQIGDGVYEPMKHTKEIFDEERSINNLDDEPENL